MPGEPRHATIGTMTLHRARGEALEAFEARTLAAGEASGAGFVVIGGLPDSDIERPCSAEAEADALAEIILTAAEPDAHDCAALADLVAFAQRTGLFTPSPRHLAALEMLRSVAEADG